MNTKSRRQSELNKSLYLLLSESGFVHWLTTLYQLVLEWEIEKADSSLFSKSQGSTQALQGKDQSKRGRKSSTLRVKSASKKAD